MGLSALSMFIVGLLGSTHCLGMCGGIIGTLNLSSKTTSSPATSPLAFNLAYNVGRIFSYAVAGLIVSFLGHQLMVMGPFAPFTIGFFISGFFMILLGLYISGTLNILGWLEQAGTHLWKHIRPLGERFLPVRSLPMALGLGLVWGWLPCGLVYSALTMAAVSGDPQTGALYMVAFGLGTLPAVLLMGNTARHLNQIVQQIWVRKVAGLFLVFTGGYFLLIAMQIIPAGHHA